MARFLSAQNQQKIMIFWKKNRKKPDGSYLARMFAPPKVGQEGESRRQTDEYRIVFEEYQTMLFVHMNGEQLALSCSTLKAGGVQGAAKQLSMLAYGNSSQTKVIAQRLSTALTKGGHDVVIRPHDRGSFLEESADEESGE